MRPPASDVRLTYDDFLQFPDDGKRHELIDGEHFVTPSPNTKHQGIVVNLAGLLWTYLRAHRRRRVFVAPFDVVFSDFDVVEPDLLFVSKARQADVLTAKHVRGAPDLVVEIGSPSHAQARRDDQTAPLRALRRQRVLGHRPGTRRDQGVSIHRGTLRARGRTRRWSAATRSSHRCFPGSPSRWRTSSPSSPRIGWTRPVKRAMMARSCQTPRPGCDPSTSCAGSSWC